MTADRIVLTIPRDEGFENVAQLVLAGVAARLNFSYEVVDDLGTALETLLERRGEGELTVELEVGEDTVKAALMRYVSHNPAAWSSEFEKYAQIRYAWTLSAEWPRLAMVQTLLTQTIYLDPVVDDWAHIKAPTLVFGGAEDSLPGSSAIFKERMKFVSETIPNGNARLQLIPGIGHVPHMEAPEKTYPPLVAFLREGLK